MIKFLWCEYFLHISQYLACLICIIHQVFIYFNRFSQILGRIHPYLKKLSNLFMIPLIHLNKHIQSVFPCILFVKVIKKQSIHLESHCEPTLITASAEGESLILRRAQHKYKSRSRTQVSHTIRGMYNVHKKHKFA